MLAQVFAQPDCAILGFPVVRGDVRRESKKLQIPDHPQASQLVQKLIASPPHTLETQRMVFEYLSGQINGVALPEMKVSSMTHLFN